MICAREQPRSSSPSSIQPTRFPTTATLNRMFVMGMILSMRGWEQIPVSLLHPKRGGGGGFLCWCAAVL